MSVIKGTPTAWTWEATLAEGDLPSTVVLESDVDDTPVNGATTDPISSNWAFDHVAAADPHTGYQLESEKGANSGYCGLDAGGLVANADLQTTVVLEADVDDVAVDGATTDPISSNWAYDHLNIAGDPHANATGIGGYSFGVLDGNIFVIPNMTDDYFLVGNATGLEQRVIADGDIPAGIARDTEVPNLASASIVAPGGLPVAGADYVGVFKITRETDSVSTLYLCVQNDENAYEWIQVAIST